MRDGRRVAPLPRPDGRPRPLPLKTTIDRAATEETTSGRHLGHKETAPRSEPQSSEIRPPDNNNIYPEKLPKSTKIITAVSEKIRENVD